MVIFAIIGILIAVILVFVAIVSLVAILEVLKIVAVVMIIPFLFLWLWAFFKQRFKLDKYISGALSLMITGATGYWVYTSWWSIMVLTIVTIILWSLYKIFIGIDVKDVKKIFELVSK